MCDTFRDLPLHPFFECFSQPIVLTLSLRAAKTSDNFMFPGFLDIYPPLIPLTLFTILLFFSFEKFAPSIAMKCFVLMKYL